MRVQGNASPTTVTVESYWPMPGYVEVRVRENIKDITPTDNGDAAPLYEYDEYVFHVKQRDGLQQEIENNLADWIQTGRMLEVNDRASTMDGTAIIAEESKVPDFDAQKDYSACPAGTPVADEGQVWTLIQPHNAANYQGRPSTLRALWGLCHTTDPAKAKAWVAPLGTSGMYMTGECYKDASGKVHRCLQDNVVYDAAALPSAWEDA